MMNLVVDSLSFAVAFIVPVVATRCDDQPHCRYDENHREGYKQLLFSIDLRQKNPLNSERDKQRRKLAFN